MQTEGQMGHQKHPSSTPSLFVFDKNEQKGKVFDIE